MTDGTAANDPMRLMRDAYEQGIAGWSKAMEEIVGSDDFAAASGQLLALYAQQQQSIRAATRVAAESIQMPTTEDLAEVAQLVINVERKVDEVTDQALDVSTRLTAIDARLAVSDAVPARLAAIEERLAEAASASKAVSERLTQIERALGELARQPAAARPTPERAGKPATTIATPRTDATASSAAAKEPAATPAKAPAPKKPATTKSAPTRRRTPPADG